MIMDISIKRVYLPAEDSDGCRVLVDRLWPRGIKKEDAKVDLWAKTLAPSAELRKWFNHIPERFEEFSKKYVEELKANPEAAPVLDELRRHDKVTLLYGAKDEQHNEHNRPKLPEFPVQCRKPQNKQEYRIEHADAGIEIQPLP